MFFLWVSLESTRTHDFLPYLWCKVLRNDIICAVGLLCRDVSSSVSVRVPLNLLSCSTHTVPIFHSLSNTVSFYFWHMDKYTEFYSSSCETVPLASILWLIKLHSIVLWYIQDFKYNCLTTFFFFFEFICLFVCLLIFWEKVSVCSPDPDPGCLRNSLWRLNWPQIPAFVSWVLGLKTLTTTSHLKIFF